MKSIKNCTLCGLCAFRKKVVLGRGVSNAQVIMIGEAPGRSEDVTGKAFSGPTYRLIESACKRATEITGKAPRIYLTNTVLCRPCDGKKEPNRQPTEEEIMACRSNVITVIERKEGDTGARVIALGQIAKRWCPVPVEVSCAHPSYINRRGGVGSSEFGVFVAQLRDAWEETV